MFLSCWEWEDWGIVMQSVLSSCVAETLIYLEDDSVEIIIYFTPTLRVNRSRSKFGAELLNLQMITSHIMTLVKVKHRSWWKWWRKVDNYWWQCLFIGDLVVTVLSPMGLSWTISIIFPDLGSNRLQHIETQLRPQLTGIFWAEDTLLLSLQSYIVGNFSQYCKYCKLCHSLQSSHIEVHRIVILKTLG